MLRLLTRPRWLLRHLAVVALCVGFFFLSRWQFHRGQQSSGTVQNYGYSVEWLIFGGFVCFGWWRLLMDELHPDQSRKSRKAGAATTSAVPAQRTNPWRTPAAVPAAEAGVPVASVPASGREDSALQAVSDLRDGPVDPFGTTEDAPRVAQLMNTTFEVDADDDEVLAYNRWLAALAANPKR